VAQLGDVGDGTGPAFGGAHIGHDLGVVEVDAYDPAAVGGEAGRARGADSRGGTGDGDDPLRQRNAP
jgi:hypothetical protein